MFPLACPHLSFNFGMRGVIRGTLGVILNGLESDGVRTFNSSLRGKPMNNYLKDHVGENRIELRILHSLSISSLYTLVIV
jgi:hypothetical protein